MSSRRSAAVRSSRRSLSGDEEVGERELGKQGEGQEVVREFVGEVKIEEVVELKVKEVVRALVEEVEVKKVFKEFVKGVEVG